MLILRINNLVIRANFRYLWLKTVKAVDLDQHCAKCLIGEYDSRISPAPSSIHGLELQDSVYYLCGVSFPFKWENNFHLAFMPQPGSTIHYESNGITVDIEEAVQLPISLDSIDREHPKARLKAYNTCRNWQFANWYKNHID